MEGYTLVWKYNLKDWLAVNTNDSWTQGNIIFRSLESAQEAALTEFAVERIEWREFNAGHQWRAHAVVQPLSHTAYMGFMIMRVQWEE